jgi:HEAT repeat protein
MSRTIRYFAIAAFAAFSSSAVFAADRDTRIPQLSPAKWAAAEKNYIQALSSDNDGVRISAATFLGRYQLKGGTDALIEMLHSDKSEQARSAAAFSLVLLNETRGVKAVEEASLYDGSDKVAAFCARLLNMQTAESYMTLEGH